MKKTLLRTGAVVGGLVLLIVLVMLFLLRGGFINLNETEYAYSNHNYKSWDDVFVKGVKVEITPMLTGRIGGGRLIFMNKENPDVDKITNTDKPMLVWAFNVHHPQRGDILIDAGFPQIDTPGFLNDITKLIVFLQKTSNLQKNNEALEIQIAANGFKPAMAFITHLHFDHVAGLLKVSNDTPIVTGKKEYYFIGKAASASYLKTKKDVRYIDFEKASPLGSFEKAVDLFGDGSLWAVSTPGHTPGHVSYIMNGVKGPMLYTGDACFYLDALKHSVEPLSQEKNDMQNATKSLMQIKKFITAYPQVTVYFGHDDHEHL